MIQKKQKTMYSFGEILWDVIEGQFHLGGAALNLAAHAAGMGMHARLISCVGEDELGRRAVDKAAQLGVDVSGIQTHRVYPTGTVLVRLNEGQPEYTIEHPVAWDFIEAPQWPCSPAMEHVDAVCFGTLAQREPASRQSLHALLANLPGTPAFFDVNLRQGFFTCDVLEWGFRRADIIKVNHAEAAMLSRLVLGGEMTSRAFARTMHDTYDVAVVLVTLGEDGCLVSTSSGVTHVPGHAVTVVDTVGAGDAFSAGFLSAWLDGHSPIEAAVVGNALGAYVATQRGAVPAYSDHLRTQLKSLIAGNGMNIDSGMEINHGNLY